MRAMSLVLGLVLIATSPLRGALRTARGDARQFRAVRGVRPGCHRQPRRTCARPPQDAGALAIGGERSLGATMAAVMRAAADDVSEFIVPQSGHWPMAEQPQQTIGADPRLLGEAAPSGSDQVIQWQQTILPYGEPPGVEWQAETSHADRKSDPALEYTDRSVYF